MRPCARPPACRIQASQSFGRRRLVQGGADEGWRPEQIFKKANSYTYQRLFGEITVEGFGVTYTKDAIQWDGQEDHVIDSIARELRKAPIDLLIRQKATACGNQSAMYDEQLRLPLIKWPPFNTVYQRIYKDWVNHTPILKHLNNSWPGASTVYPRVRVLSGECQLDCQGRGGDDPPSVTGS